MCRLVLASARVLCGHSSLPAALGIPPIGLGNLLGGWLSENLIDVGNQSQAEKFALLHFLLGPSGSQARGSKKLSHLAPDLLRMPPSL